MTTVRNGSRGAEVKTLQEALNKAGDYGLKADGIFGAKTEAAVRDYQRRNGLTIDGIAGAKTWSHLGYETMETPATPRIKKIIFHCSATREGQEISSDTIEAWHKAERFSTYKDPRTGETRHIGYHYLVHLDGSIEICRPETVRGCHTSGQNEGSIGVCYIGGVATDGKTPKDTRTPAQKAALRKIGAELQGRYPGATLHGHREFAAKACPSFDVKSEL